MTSARPDLSALLAAFAEAVAAKIQPQSGPRLLTVREAADYLKTSARSVKYMIADREIPCIRERGHVRLDREDLDKWIETHKEGARR